MFLSTKMCVETCKIEMTFSGYTVPALNFSISGHIFWPVDSHK
jgi:hypothetical protein